MKNKNIISIIFSVLLSVVFIAVAVHAATTISTNISTGGNLTVSGNSTIAGQLTVSGTATSTIAGDVNFDSGTLYIDSINNRIGIGTTNPDYKLEVAGDIRSTGVGRLNTITLEQTAANYDDIVTANRYFTLKNTYAGNPEVGFTVDDGRSLTVSISADAGANGDWLPSLNLQADYANTQTSITSSGADLRLIAGGAGLNIEFQMGDYDDYIQFKTSSNIPEITTVGSADLKINAGGSNNLLLNNAGGNVGIGTTVPAAHLQIDGNISAAAWTTDGIAFDSNAATYTDTSTAAAGTVAVRAVNSIGAPTLASTNAITVADAFSLYVKAPVAGTNTTITRTNSAYFEGNVGIGTTVPVGKLHVESTSSLFGLDLTGTYSGNYPIGITMTSNFNITGAYSGYGYFMAYNEIGTGSYNITSMNGLYIEASSWTKGTSGTITNAYGIYTDAPTIATNNYALYTEGKTVLAATAGNVGIGTTSPSNLLDLFTTGTTTLKIDSNSVSKGSCLKLKDRDGVGYTYCVVNDGVMACSATSCE